MYENPRYAAKDGDVVVVTIDCPGPHNAAGRRNATCGLREEVRDVSPRKELN